MAREDVAGYDDSVLSLRERVQLAPLTTLGVGGPARFFVEATYRGRRASGLGAFAAESPSAVCAGRWEQSRRLRWRLAGDWWCICRLGDIEQRKEGDRVVFEVAAGEDWDGFVAQSVAASCGGLECLSGIPGTVGGTPVQNVGAYGQEVADTIVKVTRHRPRERRTSRVQQRRIAGSPIGQASSTAATATATSWCRWPTPCSAESRRESNTRI